MNTVIVVLFLIAAILFLLATFRSLMEDRPLASMFSAIMALISGMKLIAFCLLYVWI